MIRLLESYDIDAKLEAYGVKKGETVAIGETEFIYS